jgi:hypothetical protein
MTDKEDIAQLRAEVTALKRQMAGTDVPSEKEVATFRDQLHQSREAQATRTATVGFSKADLAAMREAAPDDVCAGIIRDNRAVPGQRSALPPSAPSCDARGPAVPPGSGSGWAHEAPLSVPPGTRWVDRQLDAQDVKDRRELIEQKVKEQAMFAPEPE